MAQEEDERSQQGRDGSENNTNDNDDTNQDKQGKENQPRVHKFSLVLKASPKSPHKIVLRTIKSNPPSPGGSASSNTSQRSVRVRRVHTISAKASPLRPRLAELPPRRNEKAVSSEDGENILDASHPTGRAFVPAHTSPCPRRRATVSRATGHGSMEDYMKLCDGMPSAPSWIDSGASSNSQPASQPSLATKDTSPDAAQERSQGDKMPYFSDAPWPEFLNGYSFTDTETPTLVATKKPPRFSTSSDLIYFSEERENARVEANISPSKKDRPPLVTPTAPGGSQLRENAAPQNTFEDRLRKIALRTKPRVVSGNSPPASSGEPKPATKSSTAPQRLRYSLEELIRYRSSATERPAILNKPVTIYEAPTPGVNSRYHGDSSVSGDAEANGEDGHLNRPRPPRQTNHFSRVRFHQGDRSQDFTKSVRFDPAVVAWGPAYKQHNSNFLGGFYHRHLNPTNRRSQPDPSGSSEGSIIYTPQDYRDLYAAKQRDFQLLKDVISRQKHLETPVKNIQHQVSVSVRDRNKDYSTSEVEKHQQPSFANTLSKSPENISPSSKLELKIENFKKSIAEFKKAHPGLIQSNPQLIEDILEALKGTQDDDESHITPSAEKGDNNKGQFSPTDLPKKALEPRAPPAPPGTQEVKKEVEAIPGVPFEKRLNPKAAEFRGFSSLRAPALPKKTSDVQHERPFLTHGRNTRAPLRDIAEGQSNTQLSLSPRKSFVEEVRETLSCTLQRTPQEPIWLKNFDRPPNNGATQPNFGQGNWFNGLIPLVPVPGHLQFPLMPLDTPFGPMVVSPVPLNNGFANALCPPFVVPGTNSSLLSYANGLNQGALPGMEQILRATVEKGSVSAQSSSNRRKAASSSTLYEDPGDDEVDESGPGRFAKGLDPSWRERVLEEFKERYPLTGAAFPEGVVDGRSKDSKSLKETTDSSSSSEDQIEVKGESRIMSTMDPGEGSREETRGKRVKVTCRSLQSSESIETPRSDDSEDETPIQSSIEEPAPATIREPVQRANQQAAQQQGRNQPTKAPKTMAKTMPTRRGLNSIPLRKRLNPVELQRKKAATEIQQKLELLILHQKEKKALEKLTRNERGSLHRK